MLIRYPGRIVDRHVGGNTTYARRIREGMIARGVDTAVIPMRGGALGNLVAETATGLAKRENEVIHYSADTGALLKTRTASVVTVHGVASRWIDVARNPRQEFIWRSRVGRAMASSDRIITVSNSAADDIANVFQVDPSRIEVILHGVDHPGESEGISQELREAMPDGPYALYLGNVEPRKNLIALSEAFDRTPLADLGIPLVIAGRMAWNFEESAAAIDRARNVHYVGFVSNEDRLALMQGATLFVFPSLYEGFGMPVIEAMAVGTPVACSRRGSLAEVSGPSWELDDLSAEGLSNSLAAALQDSDFLAGAAQSGPEWAQRFKWDDSIDAHIRVYRSALEARL